MGLYRGQNGRAGSDSLWLGSLHGHALRVERLLADISVLACHRSCSSVLRACFLPIYDLSPLRSAGGPADGSPAPGLRQSCIAASERTACLISRTPVERNKFSM